VLRVDDDAGVLAAHAAAPAGAGAGAGAGVGLANLRARLENLHGADGTLTLSQLLPAGVRAEMRVPCAP